MAKARVLRAEFFRSRSVCRCSRDARLTLQGLWIEADDAGRGVADPRILKGAIWPLDDDITTDDIESHLWELAREQIQLYSIDGDRYYQVLRWEKYQAAAYRRAEPKHPDPQTGVICTPPAHRSVQPAHGSVLIEKGREEKIDATTSHTEFDAFWEKYPRKVSKPAARSAFAKAIRGVSLDVILAALEAQKLDKREMQFVPHAATWLNNERWNDTPEQIAPVTRIYGGAAMDEIVIGADGVAMSRWTLARQ